MSVETDVRPSGQTDRKFESYWSDGEVKNGSPADQDAERFIEGLQIAPERSFSTMYLTDVTLRDGQQQRTDEVTIGQRVDVFKSIVHTGVDRIEIGHLGNSNGDQQLAAEIVRTVAEMEEHDERYGRVKLQVLFGSQPELMKQGINVLENAFIDNYGENWQEVMADKVVVHVYDRIDENLIAASNNPYTVEESANRVSSAAQHALDSGFKHFSVSGEAATAATPETAIQFYRSLNGYLINNGAESVNDNLANTYGYSANGFWNAATMAYFNAAVKHGFDDKVSTSIHMHNDANGAVDFSVQAIVAGFDRVETTHIGMGERAGNVSGVDLVSRFLEQSRQTIEFENRRSRIARKMSAFTLSRTVAVDPEIIKNANNFYSTGEIIARTFGPHADYRWRNTILGSPYIHDNGSGPHDQLMAAAITDPVNHAPYKAYEWAIAINGMLGRPGSEELAIGDPEWVDRVTVGNHAGGGKTRQIKEGKLKRATPDQIETARQNFVEYKAEIARRALEGIEVIAS